MEILARELNIPYEKVTKKGEYTRILVGKTKEILLNQEEVDEE